MIVYCCFWLYMFVSSGICLYINVYGGIWLYVAVYGCVWLHLGVFCCIWLIWMYLFVYGGIFKYMVVFACIWLHLAITYRCIWLNGAVCCGICVHMDVYGCTIHHTNNNTASFRNWKKSVYQKYMSDVRKSLHFPFICFPVLAAPPHQLTPQMNKC